MIGEAISGVKVVGDVLDNLFTSDEERLDKAIVRQRLALKADEIQAKINQIEAGHRSVFVAGWRPFIGWICAVSLLYSFMLRDLIALIAVNSGGNVPPELPMEHILGLVIPMLGMGGFRSWEKIKGRTK